MAINLSQPDRYRWRDLPAILLLAAVYALLAKLVLTQFSETGNVTLVWFSGGMGLAVLLLQGIRYWPGIFIGGFAAGLMVDDSWWLSAIIATGNTLESVVAAWLLRRDAHFSIALSQPQHFIRLTLFGAGSSLISAALGPLGLAWLSIVPAAILPQVGLHWWMADTFGIVLVTPVLLIWRDWPRQWFRRERILETLLFVGLSALLSAVVFLDIFNPLFGKVTRGYWMFVLMFWGAMRFGRYGVLLVSTLTAVMALYGEAHNIGYFAHDFEQTGLLNFWFYMATLSWIGTILALILHDNRLVTQGLQDSERHLKNIIDASPVPYAIYNDAGQLTLLNPAFIKTFGYTLDDIPTLSDWWPKAYPDPHYRQTVIDQWQTIVKYTRQNLSFETMEATIQTKEGRLRSVLAGGVSLGDTLLGSHLVILFDITERVESSKALAESHLLLQTILETLPIRVFWQDRQSRYLGANKLFAQDAGLHSTAEILGKDDAQLAWQAQAALYQADDQQVMVSGNSKLNYEEPQTTPTGKQIWLNTSKLPLRNAEQDIIGVLGIYEDITERKQAELDLAQSLSLLQATFEATADGILVVDLNGKISGYNQRFLEIWRLPIELMQLADDKKALDFALQQLADPQDFLDKVLELYAQPERESYDLLTFKDGKYIERYSRPQRLQGQVVGRVWSFRDTTARRRVEEQLLWRTTFLESLLESSPDGIITVDRFGNKLLQNHRVVELWGIPPEITENPDDAAQVEFAKTQVLNPQQFVEKIADLYAHPELSSQDEIELINGTILERFSSPVHDRLGTYYGRIWQFRDITGRRRAERDLQQKAYYQRALLDNFPFMVWLKDKDSRFLAVNKIFVENFGVDAQRIVGQTDFEIAPAEMAARYRADDQAVMVNKQTINVEEQVIVRGQLKWAETYKTPLLDEQGEVMGTVGFARDITQRKQADEQLKLAALVYQNSSEAMVVTDADNHILTVNPAFTGMTGYTLEDVQGKTPKILASGEHDSEFYQAMWQAIDATGSWRGEIKNRRKSGELYIVELTINTIFDSQGLPLRRVAMFSDITQRKRSEEQIWQQANFDPLTGLPNRRLFRDRLALEIKKAHRMGQRFALLFIDLDRFKEVNDTLGHEIGDALLKQAALRLVACVRESDTVARLGGDEFTIILSELDNLDSPQRVSKNLLQKLSEPFNLADERVYVSASIGITIYPEDSVDLGQLLKNADQAMYAAKNQGRNGYSFFTRSMQESLKVRAALLGDLRHALGAGQLVLCYQPIVELETGSIHKAEALLRWQHPQRGLVSPAEFIPLAEESGLINEIGDWVFRTAAEQAVYWRQSLHAEFQISINKSPVQFRNPEHEASVWVAHLQQLGLPGQGLVVEITEGLLLDASSKVAEHLLVFRDAGIQVAIDDFGTGYSALSYLKKFDIDYLKIDQSFVRNLSAESSDFVLCEAIIVMAHKLGLKVIAEGVETEPQRLLLAAIGCDYVQGYLFAKPLFADEFERRFGRE